MINEDIKTAVPACIEITRETLILLLLSASLYKLNHKTYNDSWRYA